MEVKRKTLVLSFVSAIGEVLNVTINKPNDELEASEIAAAMDQMVASQALGCDSSQRPIDKKAAKYVVQQQEEISLS